MDPILLIFLIWAGVFIAGPLLLASIVLITVGTCGLVKRNK